MRNTELMVGAFWNPILFFFSSRRRHTRLQGDWSSDVCSSDLRSRQRSLSSASDSHRTSVEETIRKLDNERIQAQIHADATALDRIYAADFIGVGQIGRASCRERV